MIHDDIGFLVEETFSNASKTLEQGFRFGDEFISPRAKSMPMDCAGLIYSIKKTTSLFVLRICACEDIDVEFEKILMQPEQYPDLRLSEVENIRENLHFFPCDSYELAQKLKKQFANKRFPLFEEFILNVSDPGDSWWLSTNENSFRINFKLSHTNEIQELTKLGPLGDSFNCARIFGELAGYFQMLFPVVDSSSTSSEFRINCSHSHHPLFNSFIELLETGETSFDFWESLRAVEVKYQDSEFISSIKEANQFIMELSQKRAFWIQATELI